MAFATLLILTGTLGVPAHAAPAPAAGPAVEESVSRQVRAKLRLEKTHPVKVSVRRGDSDSGAFGTAVVPGGTELPQGWLFLYSDGRTALEGDPDFAKLATKVPSLSDDEKRVFTSRSAPDYRTGMRLPFALGQSWYLTGGPHTMAGGPRSSIDLAGGDGRVLAARGGLAYTMCNSGKGWLRVVHDNGFSTDYYHLEGNIAADGKALAEGDFLGNIGNDVSCGGRSSGKHVHFALRRDGAYTPIDHYAFGKWVIRASGSDYDGYALHGSTRRDAGQTIQNHGVLGPRQGIVDTDGGTALNRRSGPGTSNPVAGTVADGETVDIVCSAPGTEHAGRDGYRSSMWDKLADGTWVSDVYLWTGTGEPVAGYC